MPFTRARTSTSREPAVCAGYSNSTGTVRAFTSWTATTAGGMPPPAPWGWPPPGPQAASAREATRSPAIRARAGKMRSAMGYLWAFSWGSALDLSRTLHAARVSPQFTYRHVCMSMGGSAGVVRRTKQEAAGTGSRGERDARGHLLALPRQGRAFRGHDAPRRDAGAGDDGARRGRWRRRPARDAARLCARGAAARRARRAGAARLRDRLPQMRVRRRRGRHPRPATREPRRLPRHDRGWDPRVHPPGIAAARDRSEARGDRRHVLRFRNPLSLDPQPGKFFARTPRPIPGRYLL